MDEKDPGHRKFLGLDRDVWTIWTPIGLIVLLGFVLTIRNLDPPAPQSFSIATGSEEGAYYGFAQQFRHILASERYKYDLKVVSTAGSIENLDLLRRGEVELALVQGGTLSDEDLASTHGANGEPGAKDESLQALASLYFEPLWVFHRAERPLDKLADLEGWRIAIGLEGSGTRALAELLLKDNDIDAQNSQFVTLSSIDAATALENGEIDAAFFVTSPQAAYIEELLRSEDVALLSFRRHRAYSIKNRFLSRVVLGEGSVNIAQNLPPEDVSLLAVTASLVARKSLHPDLIPPLIETLKDVFGEGGTFESAGQFPSVRYNELPLKPEAARYLTNGPPFLYRIPGISFRVAALIDRLKILLLPLITLLIPLGKIAPPIYRWRIRSSIYRWYEDLKLLDEVLRNPPEREALGEHLKKLERLEDEVTEVQVPLSYMDEFYRLRTHIELIRSKLERLQREAPAG